MPRDPRAYLFDIIQAGNRIERFVGSRSFAQYAADELIRAGVERQFEIIGEALNQLHKLDATLVSEIREHRKVTGFRNVLIHGYAEVDDAVVWSIVIEKLPLLRHDVQALLHRLDTQE